LTTVVHKSDKKVYCYDYFTLPYLVLYYKWAAVRKKIRVREKAASPNVAYDGKIVRLLADVICL
jgi:hypothetical protein